MSKVIRTTKPSVLPWYAAALVFAVLCAVLPVYRYVGTAGGAGLRWRGLWCGPESLPAPGGGHEVPTPAAAAWTRCWPTSSRSWTPSTH